MLQRTGFSFDVDDMKYYDIACGVFFLNKTIVQRYAVRVINNIKTDDLLGLAQYVEAGSWHPIFTNGK